jgi:hypothetical protein
LKDKNAAFEGGVVVSGVFVAFSMLDARQGRFEVTVL